MCHTGAMPKAGLNLSEGMAHAALTDGTSGACSDSRALVVAGEPAESYLVNKLLGADLCMGKRMPPSAALAADKIKTITDWICAGALDD